MRCRPTMQHSFHTIIMCHCTDACALSTNLALHNFLYNMVTSPEELGDIKLVDVKGYSSTSNLITTPSCIIQEGWNVTPCTALNRNLVDRYQHFGEIRCFHLQAPSKFLSNDDINKGCPESIQPFWVSREPVACPWWKLAASQRKPYCASVSSHSPMGLVSQQWDAFD